MKMKIGKIFVCTLILVSVFVASPVRAYADITTAYQGKIKTATSITWTGSKSSWSHLSFDALSDLCVSFNTDPGWDTVFGIYFAGIDLVNKSATIASRSVSGGTVYYIEITQSGASYVLCNQFGYPFYATADTDSILSSIIFSLSRMVQTDGFFDDFIMYFQLINQKCQSLDTAIKGFINGKTVTDVITAIENIPASVYDDSKLLVALGRIENNLGDLNIDLDFGDISADLSGVNTRLDSLIQNVMYISQTTLSDPDKLWNSSVVASGGWAWNEGTFSYTSTSETYTESTQLMVSFSNLSVSNNCTVLTLPASGAAYTGLEFQGDVAFVSSGSPITVQLLNSLGNVISSTTVQTRNWTIDVGTSTASYTLPLTSSVAKVRLTFSSNVSTSLLSNFKVYGNARTGVGGSTGDLEFYVDGQHYTIGLPATAVNREYTSGAVVRSTVYYDSASWYFRASAASEPVQLSEEITATLNGYLRSEAETVTWFSWFYDYTMNFQSWLGGKIDAIPGGSGGGGSGSGSTVDLSAVIASVDAVGVSVNDMDEHLAANLDLLAAKLDIIVDNSQTSVDNVTNVVIDQTNNAYNVFYVTGEDGETHSIGEVTGSTLSASGKLLNFLYKLCVEGALSKVDDSISGMSDFYFDSGTGTEGSIWD